VCAQYKIAIKVTGYHNLRNRYSSSTEVRRPKECHQVYIPI